MVEKVVYFRAAEERLGGDTAPIEADAAEMLALDERGFQAKLRGANGGPYDRRGHRL